METWLHDIRFGLRILFKRPGFSLSAIATLALGIGVSGAVFNLAMASLFPQLPVQQPDRLAAIFQFGDFGGGNAYFSSLSYPTYRDYVERLRSFEGIAAFQSGSVNMSHGGAAARVAAELVSPNYFHVLGVGMALGRALPAAVEEGLDDQLVVLSNAFWRSEFGADTALIGETISLNGHQFTVGGVTADGFAGLELGSAVDVWVPLSTRDRLLTWWRPEYGESRTSHQLAAVGRLSEGVSIGGAAEEAEALAARLAEAHPEGQAGWTARVIPASEAMIWPGRRGELVDLAWALAVIVGLILALACANVANMLLGRVADRRGEIGVRLALGAGRRRVARQLLLESLVLVLPAALLALVAAAWVSEFLARFQISGLLPAGLAVPVDGRTVVFMIAAAALVAVLTGLAPAVQVFGWRPGTGLRGGRGEGGGTDGSGAVKRGLSVVQIAGSLAVLASGGLLVRSAITLLGMDLGFVPEPVALVTVDPAASGYTRSDAFAFYRRALEEIDSLPGVGSAALAATVPMGRMRFATSVVVGDGADEVPRSVTGNVVTPGYLATMGIQLARGRDFREGESGQSLIVSQAAARSFWPGMDPLGRRLTLPGYSEEAFTVVGVAGDARLGRQPFAELEPFIYLPMDFSREASAGPAPALIFHVRTSGVSPAAAIPLVRSVIAHVAPGLPAFGARTLRSQVRSAIAPALATATYVSILGVLGLLLAAVGTYAVIDSFVSQRKREIGVRVALGAEPGRVVRFVVAGGVRLTGVGVAVGLVGGLLAARMLRGSLHGIDPSDPLAFILATAVTVAVSLGALYIPARRAARLDPQQALRGE